MTPLRFAVIGDPVAHSKSPAMHMAAFRALGLPHTYEAVRVTEKELPAIVQELRAGKWAGLNVTVPHKQMAAMMADETAVNVVPPVVNTLVRTADGRIKGYNTDVPALAEELRILAGPLAPWSAMRSLVLGSGGAARAAVAALWSLGAKDIAVRARRPDGPATQGWQRSVGSEEGTLAVVQATSAGMTGADPGEAVAAVVAWDALPKDAIALDVVYAPPETPFLRAARARGLRCTNGLGMLVRQGALAFELWLGAKPPLDVMRRAVEGTG